MPAPLSRIVCRKEEWHCVLYHLLVVAAYCIAFALWMHPELAGLESAGAKVVFIIAAAPLLGWISGIDIGVNYHNHVHRPLFRSSSLNLWFERLWSPFGGWPAKYWSHYHIAVHHERLMSEGDWTVRLQKGNGEYESCLRYQLRIWPWRSLRNFPTEIRDGHFDKRTASVEMMWFLVVYSVPFLLDPTMGFCLWLLPHWCANSVTMGRGMYIQHAGCESWLEDKTQPHSANFLAPAFNLTMFNIGYHIEHHDLPGLHWSELPAVSEALAQSRV